MLETIASTKEIALIVMGALLLVVSIVMDTRKSVKYRLRRNIQKFFNDDTYMLERVILLCLIKRDVDTLTPQYWKRSRTILRRFSFNRPPHEITQSDVFYHFLVNKKYAKSEQESVKTETLVRALLEKLDEQEAELFQGFVEKWLPKTQAHIESPYAIGGPEVYVRLLEEITIIKILTTKSNISIQQYHKLLAIMGTKTFNNKVHRILDIRNIEQFIRYSEMIPSRRSRIMNV